MRPRLSWWLAVAVLVLAGFTGSSQAQQGPRIPLRAGLTIVTALNEPDRGDYESIKTITRADAKDVSLRYSAEAPASKNEDNPFAAILGGGQQPPAKKSADAKETRRISTVRTVTREELKSARHYQHYFSNNSPERYPGSTAVGLSSAILGELKTKGTASFTIQAGGLLGELGTMLGGLLGGLGAGSSKDTDELTRLSGSLKRVEAAAVPFKVIVNDVPVELPAVHAKGTFGDQDAEFWILDDVENPLSLKWNIGEGKLQVIRLSFPAPAETRTAGGAGAGGGGGGAGAGSGGSGAGAARIEKALEEEGRAVVYGIYFDFASDRIKEESEPVLKEIADVMTKNPAWRLTVEGHTDSIGTNEANLDLSQRRAAAVRKALGERHKVAATRLEPSGFGESRPKDTNDTLEGRARNRRVELARIGR
jgi:outer membrane protein OmpA-like peptidoglycan-associated protein